MFKAYNHNGTLIAESNSASDIFKQAKQYHEQTGNAYFIEEDEEEKESKTTNKYRVFACYVVELYCDIEANSKDEAWDKAYHLDGSDYTVCNEDGWQIDRIEEITNA